MQHGAVFLPRGPGSIPEYQNDPFRGKHPTICNQVPNTWYAFLPAIAGKSRHGTVFTWSRLGVEIFLALSSPIYINININKKNHTRGVGA